MSEHPPADWYPDPEVPGQQRYWDGSQWTEHRAPGGGSQAVAPADGQATTPGATSSQPSWQDGAPAGGQAWGNAGAPTDQAPQTWLWQSIVATVLCCLPFGVAGIVFAAQANSAVSSGDYSLAQAKAKQAKLWTLIAVGVGLLIIVGYFVFFAAVIAGEGNF